MAKANQMRMLSDDEKLAIMNQAIIAAEEQGIDFEVVFSAALEAYLEAKEKKQQQIMEDEEMDMTPAPEFQQQEDDFEMDMTPAPEFQQPEDDFEMDMTPAPEFQQPEEDFEMDMTPAPEFQQQEEDFGEMDMTPAAPELTDEQRVTVGQQLRDYFQRKRQELLDKIGSVKGVTPGMIIDAKDGLIIDSDKYFYGTYADSETIAFVNELNANSRASYYDKLMLASDEELEAMRDSTVGVYGELAEEAIEEKDYWDREDQLHPEKDVWNLQHQPTLTFDNLQSMRTHQGRHRTGVSSPTGYGSDPLGYDEFFSEARERVGKGKSHTKNLFDQALLRLRENIEKVSKMTASEFRAFKVNQMSLSDSEIELFDEERNNMIRSYGLGDDEDSFTDERGYEEEFGRSL